jgi:hypothetical protein
MAASCSSCCGILPMPPDKESNFRESRVGRLPSGAPPMPSLTLDGVEIDAQVRTYFSGEG